MSTVHEVVYHGLSLSLSLYLSLWQLTLPRPYKAIASAERTAQETLNEIKLYSVQSFFFCPLCSCYRQAEGEREKRQYPNSYVITD